MHPQRQQQADQDATTSGERAIQQPPSISLPKGGGAIRGIGEKFAANPVTGTGSMSVPIATSPGRSGFDPALSLAYDSGAGNGIFGFGWNLSLPSITRKTDKGLPRYHDTEQSDVFILSGAEDLVPEYKKDQVGNWIVIDQEPRTVDGIDYTVRRYRPRIEGLFARIERWTRQCDGDVHWRSISKDNILTLYGKDDKSRIFDPAHPQHIFSWLICETRDDKGSAIIFDYAEEDGVGIDLTQNHERNRGDHGDAHRQVNRYIKHICYGNQESLLDTTGKRPHLLASTAVQDTHWLFEVVFDYGEHDASAPTRRATGDWLRRHDPFSTYRAGFEVRTYRLCQRVLIFHHFPNETDVGADCLVRSTDFVYRDIRNNSDDRKKGHPVASFIASITQSGYKRQGSGGYSKQSLPPIEFDYSEVPNAQELSQQPIEIVNPESLENLPSGLDGTSYRWVDLDGEGLSGILAEQGGAWFYKRNLSSLPVNGPTAQATVVARFAPTETVALQPSSANLNGGRQQLMDLAGDGQLDLVQFQDPLPGFFERTHDERWETFKPFMSLPNIDWDDPNLKFVDLNGDGHADVLITEHDVFTWYPSLAEDGFGPARSVHKPLNEEKGPRLVFADGTQSIYSADMCGDGLTDLVRIRNGEVCYWPNLGYGHFSAKVTMDNAPWFDHSDQFNQQRVRLADIDGSGTNDIIYLGRDNVRLYFNESGNRWSEPHSLRQFPPVDNLTSVMTADLLGNGTACLVWSSPHIGDAGQHMRYIDLMGGQKPHLLTNVVNNLGVETHIHYAPSTKFYLADRLAGRPWITKLPFLVHVVEQVVTCDHISDNRFTTQYEYHHGYFDGIEREFRGFGMVEQRDTEEFAALTTDGTLPEAANLDGASHVPPVLTRTWFHTGIYLGRDRVSNFFAGEHDRGEYYREPAWLDDYKEVLKRLLPDTVMPPDLTLAEEREACRALKGTMLRQEVYALDGSGTTDYPYGHPYTVTEQNFTIERLQPYDGNCHAVFFTHAREVINYHYERNPADPRISHTMTLEVDSYGNALREVAINYPRRDVPERLSEQNEINLTLTLNWFANVNDQTEWYRTGLPVETRTYEVVKPPATTQRFTWKELSDLVTALVPLDQHEPLSENVIPYERWDWRKQWDPQTEPGGLIDDKTPHIRLRLIEHIRTLYRPNDMGETQNDPLTLLSLEMIESLALLGESYKLAFTPDLLAEVFQRDGQPLLAIQADVLSRQGADRGGHVVSKDLKDAGFFPDTDPDDHWWIPSGRTFYSPNTGDDAPTELAYSTQHFYTPLRYRNPFGEITTVALDDYDLLMLETIDPLDNKVTATNDYRTLQPIVITDPNGNRSQVVFDALGMVAGTAMMGKVNEVLGDTLTDFESDLSQSELDVFYDSDDPHTLAQALLHNATTCNVYDMHRFHQTKQMHPDDPALWQPVYAATIARETHVNETMPGDAQKIQISFSYSDGFGSEIQKKIQAEPVTSDGADDPLRWVASGWTIFNNKSKPVRQYEPFFSDLPVKRHQFEFGNKVGVSPILFYDPLGRVVATLHPNHTYEKVVFDPWKQTTWDVNDTVTLDPATDDHVSGFFLKPDDTPRLADDEYKPSWYELRTEAQYTTRRTELWPDERTRNAEIEAASKVEMHTNTPTIAHLDSLGRPFLTFADNGFDPSNPGQHMLFATRVELDIEGNEREVRDANKKAIDARGIEIIDELGRIVMRYDYDMLGNRIHQASMEAGERWMLNDVTGKPIRAWDSRGHNFRTAYDPLRRPIEFYVKGVDNKQSDKRTLVTSDIMFEKIEYGEGKPGDKALNLRAQIFRQYDAAGIVTNEAYDFKGNLTRTKRQVAKEYKAIPDWSRAVEMDHEIFQSSAAFDALNRPIRLFTPHTTAMPASVIRPGYNEANLLERIDVMLRGEQANGQPVWTPFVTNIDYDAKGQRTRIDYGNSVTTIYHYDLLTFRLSHLQTRRSPSVYPNDCSQPPLAQWPGCDVQNLHYTYDPVGNITHIRDDAQQTIFFDNKRVEPSAEFTYDAIYRLIEATGREHLGQIGGGQAKATPPDELNTFHMNHAHPGDGKAMGRYIEKYVYDEVGNFKEMNHHTSNPAVSDWTRDYTYNEASLIEPNKKSNRLSSTAVTKINGQPVNEPYTYDAHGNMITMPHLHVMQRDFKDQLQAISTQVVNNGGLPEITYYVYDAAGQRVRKVIQGSLTKEQVDAGEQPKRKNERIYLDGFEIYSEYDNGDDPTLKRETLHIMDDKQRIALVETETEPILKDPLIRYQLGNHLGSASVELDANAKPISYEEYYPYGSTSYQAVDKKIRAAAKRYRYTGKERDEESSLYYHGARYYAPWLGRWMSCDPDGLEDGVNLYIYSKDTPILLFDPSGKTSVKPGTLDDLNRAANALRIGVNSVNQANTLSVLGEASGVEIVDKGGAVRSHLSKLESIRNALQNRPKRIIDILNIIKTKDPALYTQKLRELQPLLTQAGDRLPVVRETLNFAEKIRNSGIQHLKGIRIFASGSPRVLNEQLRALSSKLGNIQPLRVIPNQLFGQAQSLLSRIAALRNNPQAAVGTGGALAVARVAGKSILSQVSSATANVLRSGAARITGISSTRAISVSGVALAGVAAVGSIALATETARATVTGQKTPAVVARETYGDAAFRASKETGIQGSLKRFALAAGGTISEIMSWGQ